MTTLKRSYASQDEVPTNLFIEQDGKWIWNPDIEIDGMIPSNRLEPFRDSNVKLKQRVEAYGGTITVDAQGRVTGFGGVDPDKVHDLLGREQELSDGNLTKKSEVNTRVEQRVAEEKQKFEKEKGKLQTQLDATLAKLRKVSVEGKALDLALPLGLRKDAKEALALMVNERWSIDAESGEPVAYEADGKTVRYDGGGNPMRGEAAMKRDIESMAKDRAKFLFEDNQGGGADGSTRGASNRDDLEVNPFDPKTFNRTRQTELVKNDFPKAQRMAKKHGIDLKPSSVTSATKAA